MDSFFPAKEGLLPEEIYFEFFLLNSKLDSFFSLLSRKGLMLSQDNGEMDSYILGGSGVDEEII